MPTTNPQIRLPLAHYRFHFVAESPIQLPAYSGSAWRGLFGHSLKRTVCVTHERDCRQCLLWRSCVYSYIFETPPPAGTERMRKYTAAPHPFVIRPDPNQNGFVAAGQPLAFDLVLVDHANQHLPYIIHALQRAGEQGIGQQRGKFSLRSVLQWDTGAGAAASGWQSIYTHGAELTPFPPQTPAVPELTGERVTLRFLTPFRYQQQGRLVRKQHFQFYHVLSSLMRRLSLLSYFHTRTPLDMDFKALTEQAKKVPVLDNALSWYDWQRYSSRQQNRVKMGGLVGEVQLAAEAIAPFWSLLSLGEWLHTGKGTVMGLGQYQLREYYPGPEDTPALDDGQITC